ncbi:hypothetical protein MMC31_001741, partial [Peltigera leucophlebia]|nr:hypothetical protein [Peltigera leucophlebia]
MALRPPRQSLERRRKEQRDRELDSWDKLVEKAVNAKTEKGETSEKMARKEKKRQRRLVHEWAQKDSNSSSFIPNPVRSKTLQSLGDLRINDRASKVATK